MTAAEVLELLKDHEKHCDARQAKVHEKLDTLARLVYIGLGLVLAAQFAVPLLIG